MGLFQKMGIKAMEKMAKDNFESAWSRGIGCGGRPSYAATRAIQDAAVAIYSATNSGDISWGRSELAADLGRYKEAVDNNGPQMSLGAGVLYSIFRGLQGYEWAVAYVDDWDLRHAVRSWPQGY